MPPLAIDFENDQIEIKPPVLNRWKLTFNLDIHGNAAEWCANTVQPISPSIFDTRVDTLNSDAYTNQTIGILKSGDFASEWARHRTAYEIQVSLSLSFLSSPIRLAKTINSSGINAVLHRHSGREIGYAISGDIVDIQNLSAEVPMKIEEEIIDGNPKSKRLRLTLVAPPRAC